MQSLTVIGTPIAWLFAKPDNSDSKNGFTATGGKFNYTAEVKFPESGDIARIFMTFSGLDVFDNLKATVRLEGTVPKLSRGRSRNKVNYWKKSKRINNSSNSTDNWACRYPTAYLKIQW